MKIKLQGIAKSDVNILKFICLVKLMDKIYKYASEEYVLDLTEMK